MNMKYGPGNPGFRKSKWKASAASGLMTALLATGGFVMTLPFAADAQAGYIKPTATQAGATGAAANITVPGTLNASGISAGKK